MNRDIIQTPHSHNNLFSTCYLNKYLTKINQTFDFNNYNYTDNRLYYDYLSDFFCQNKKYIYYDWSSDFIIRNIFMHLNKNIWFENPNYGMLNVYSELFNLKITNKNANNLYITFPNINTPNPFIKTFTDLLDFLKRNQNKNIILDLAYYNNLFSFYDLKEIIREIQKVKKDINIIFSFTKFTGNANMKQGILISKNKLIEKLFLFSNPHRINNLIQNLIMNLNENILENHRIILLNLLNKTINKLNPDYYYGFNLFFKKKKLGRYINNIKLYRYSINDCRKVKNEI